MAKRWVATHNADKRAIELHLRLREIEQMPLIYIECEPNEKTIIIGDKGNRRMYRELGVDHILLLNPQQAKDKGGTFEALMKSWKRAKPLASQTEIEEGVQRFLLGDQNQ